MCYGGNQVKSVPFPTLVVHPSVKGMDSGLPDSQGSLHPRGWSCSTSFLQFLPFIVQWIKIVCFPMPGPRRNRDQAGAAGCVTPTPSRVSTVPQASQPPPLV